MKVKVEKVGNRILLVSERPTPGLKSAIPGAYFRKDGMWSMPLDMETCGLLREHFAARLEIGPVLTEWAKAEKAHRAQQTATAGAADAELTLLPTVAPHLSAAMDSRRYQRAAARFVADSKGRDGTRRALIADTVGLGKTAEALAGVLESAASGPFLVICPKGAVNTAWTPEIRRWLPEDQIVTVPDGRAARENILNNLRDRAVREPAALGRTWVVIHPAAIRTQTWWGCHECGSRTKYRSGLVNTLDCGHDKVARTPVIDDHSFPQLFQMAWGAVIVDESDQVLIRKTGTPNLQRRGAEMLRDLVRSGGVRLAMSGTPFRSKPHQLWSTLNWLDPKRWSSKWNWVGKYYGLGGYSGYEIGAFVEGRDLMLKAELSDVMIRRRREEVRGDLPSKLYGGAPLDPADSYSPVGVWLDLTPKQRKAYDAMAKSAEAEIEGGTLSAIGILAELTRLKQFAGASGRLSDSTFVPSAEGCKYEWIVEKLREIGLPDRPETKIVIASQFTQMLNAFADGLRKEFKKLHVGLITGETARFNTATVAEFEDTTSDLHVLLINTKAGGSAITLDAAEIMVICDETWVDDEQEQLEGRIDNRQPERRIVPRTYYYLRAKDTIEEKIAIANQEAKRAGRKVLDGGAAQFAKEALGS